MGKLAYRAGSIEFSAVRPHRNSSNHCDACGSMPPGQVRVSSRWFDHTKHPPHHTECTRTTLLIGGFRPSGQFRVSSGSFDLSEPPRTSVMQGRWRGTQACRAVLREFGVVRQDRTSTIHFDVGGGRLTAKFRVSSGWLYHTEPPRTTLIHRSCRTTPNSLKTAL